MNHRVDLRVLLEDLLQRSRVRDVDIVEGRALSREELNTVEGFLGRVVEVVNNHNIVSRLKKLKGGE